MFRPISEILVKNKNIRSDLLKLIFTYISVGKEKTSSSPNTKCIETDHKKNKKKTDKIMKNERQIIMTNASQINFLISATHKSWY